MQKIKAAFFDRDGTLIKDVNYLSKLEDVHLLPEAIIIAQTLQRLGYRLFVVTNQSGIARGFFDEFFVHQTHVHLDSLLAQHNISIQKYYHCPHLPDHGCFCRKPKPGMLITAAQEYQIDLSASLMFGDKETDLGAGHAAGCKSFDISALFGLSQETISSFLGNFRPDSRLIPG